MAKLDTAQLIAQLLNSILAIGPAGLDLFLKLDSLRNLGPDEQTNVANAIKAGLAADADALAAIEAWKRQVGL
jgi:hypothetical protein